MPLLPEDEVKIALRVHPGATRNEVVGIDNGVWRLKIAAVPKQGRANRELVDFLSKILATSKSRINIVKGRTARNKLVAISGLSQEDITRRLARSQKS